MSVKAMISFLPSFQLQRPEQADLLRDCLLDVDVVAVFGAAPPGGDDGIGRIQIRIDQCQIHRLAIACP
jgi:hypothetical protein